MYISFTCFCYIHESRVLTPTLASFPGSLLKKIGEVEPGNTQMEKCTLAQLSHSTHCPEPHTWGQEVEKGWRYHTYTVWSQ